MSQCSSTLDASRYEHVVPILLLCMSSPLSNKLVLLHLWNGEMVSAHSFFVSVTRHNPLHGVARVLSGNSGIKTWNKEMRGDKIISLLLPAAAPPPTSEQDKVHGVSTQLLQCFWLLYKQLLISSMSKEKPARCQITTASAFSSTTTPTSSFLVQTSATTPPLPSGAVTLQQQRKYTKIKWVLSFHFT